MQMEGTAEGGQRTRSPAEPDCRATVTRAAVRPVLRIAFWIDDRRLVRFMNRIVDTCPTTQRFVSQQMQNLSAAITSYYEPYLPHILKYLLPNVKYSNHDSS